MPTRRCPTCAGTAWRVLAAPTADALTSYYRCDQCGHSFASATAKPEAPPDPAHPRLPTSPMQAAIVEARADVDAAHAAGTEALRSGDYMALDDAIRREADAMKKLFWMVPKRAASST